MKTTALKYCAALAIATAVTPAFATLTVDSATRSIDLTNAPGTQSDSVSTTSGNYTNSFTDSGGSEDTATNGSVSQNTDILPLIFGGSGHAHINAHPNSPFVVSASSSYSVTFTIDSDYLWVSSGNLTRIIDGGSAAGNFQFFDITHSSIVIERDTISSSNVDIAGNGIITAGQYSILFTAGAFGFSGNSFATADFVNTTVTLRPLEVPEPASLGVLAIGASALMLRRKSRA